MLGRIFSSRGRSFLPYPGSKYSHIFFSYLSQASTNTRILAIYFDQFPTMDASYTQNRSPNVRPNSEIAQTFEDVPLTPLHDGDQLSSTSSGFCHVPLDHEIVASGSAWDDGATADELCEGEGKGIVPVGWWEEGGGDVVVSDGSDGSDGSVTSRDPEENPVSAVLSPGSDLVCSTTIGSASTVTLVETLLALETIPGSAVAVNDVTVSAEVTGEQSRDFTKAESDINDNIDKPSEHANRLPEPTGLTTSMPQAMVITHRPFPRIERPQTPPPISTAASFEIPIPIFPFPAGTSRRKNRSCPIKIRHEQGPYLHEGKLRTREGEIFGSSNPPPEIWFLYDLERKAELQGTGKREFGPVELFVRFHFGETRGGCVGGLDGKVGNGREEEKRGGRRLRSWGFWR